MKILLACFVMLAAALPKVGTSAKVGEVEGVTIEVSVNSPSAQDTPLQIICAFEYVEGDIFTSPPALPRELNGLVHVDEALRGLITELRKSGKFGGKPLETLLITPPKNTLPARKILLVGLGPRASFDPVFMKQVGITGMREALRIGVTSYSHASDLKDGGFDSPTALVAGLIAQGAIEAFRTQKYLASQDASSKPVMNKVSILCGPAYFTDSKEGVQKVLKTL